MSSWIRIAGLLFVCLLFPSLSAGATDDVVLVVGDSISSAYGMPLDKGWVKLLGDRVTARRFPHRVVNVSISGDTSASAASRLPALLRQHRPAIVIIEIGGNDGLRGLPLANTRSNLAGMVRNARRQGAQVMLLGIDVPPNLGPKYAGEFRALYAAVAKAEKAVLIPGFVAKVGQNPDLMQSDGIHPNQYAQPELVNAVWPELEKMLSASGAP